MPTLNNHPPVTGKRTHWLYSKLAPKTKLKTGSEIVRWWESKRLLFNGFNLLSTVVGALLVYAAMPHLISFFALPFIVGYWLLINLAYFTFWLPLIFIKKTWPNTPMEFMVSCTFIFVLVSSSVITLACFLAVILFNIT